MPFDRSTFNFDAASRAVSLLFCCADPCRADPAPVSADPSAVNLFRYAAAKFDSNVETVVGKLINNAKAFGQQVTAPSAALLLETHVWHCEYQSLVAVPHQFSNATSICGRR